ncbi:MAG: hypothetical protein VKJ06_06260 [Vampirovibrionales bacterium]|nr:hypothetical protein [Vampirovibrionales bacterium]
MTKLALTTGRSKALLIEEALNHYCELLSGQIEAIEAGLQDADAGQFYSTQDILTDLEQVRVSRLPMD